MGIAPIVKYGTARDDSQRERIAASADDPPCPESLLALYREIGDGFQFQWSEVLDPSAPFDDEAHDAKVTFPPLSVLIERRHEYRDGWWATADFSEYHVDDPELATRTAQCMRQWTWFSEEPNGDRLCIDFATGEVVYDQHDWHDAGSAANGDLMSSDILTFLEGWASVCFTAPRGRYWPDCFMPTGVAWTPDYFSARYVLSESVCGDEK
jgi:hypothetical protein